MLIALPSGTTIGPEDSPGLDQLFVAHVCLPHVTEIHSGSLNFLWQGYSHTSQLLD